MPVKSPADFIRLISDELGLAESRVEELLDIGEAKDGWFYAYKKPGKWLEMDQFKALCRLARSLGGEYVSAEQMWRVPGPMAQQPQPKPEQDPAPAISDVGALTWIPINRLLSLPFPLRVEDRGLEELAESIKRYGVLGPILVRPHRDPGWYEIVAGERRVRAAALAGLTTVPCRVKELSDEEVYEVAMVENVQREDLTDYEIARTLEHMITKFGYTHEQLAEKLEKSRTWVTNHLRILKLEKDYNVSMETLENITERQARMILSAPEEKRKEIIQKIKETGEIPSSLQIEAEYAPGPEPGAETPVEKPQEPLSTSVEPLAPGQLSEAPASPPAPQPMSNVEAEETAEPEPEELDVAEFTCKVCGEEYIIVHVEPGVHKLRRVRRL